MKKKIITTSWDDGPPADLKIGKLLDKYGLKGTFYIPQKEVFSRLTDQEILALAKKHEIGAHTVNHVRLGRVDYDKAKQEVVDSKKWLDDLLQKSTKMFCYPDGSFNDDTLEIIKSANFLGSRTTKSLVFDYPHDFFQMDTTVQLYPFPFRKRDKDHYHLSKFLLQPLQKKFLSMVKLGLSPTAFFSWNSLTKSLFDHFLKHGGVYHFWGHGHDLDRFDMWDDLEKHFKYISNREDCVYLTNSQVLELKDL